MGDESVIVNQISNNISSFARNIVIIGNIADNMAPNGTVGSEIFNFVSTTPGVSIIQDNNATND
jgi:hypothetical protein